MDQGRRLRGVVIISPARTPDVFHPPTLTTPSRTAHQIFNGCLLEQNEISYGEFSIGKIPAARRDSLVDRPVVSQRLSSLSPRKGKSLNIKTTVIDKVVIPPAIRPSSAPTLPQFRERSAVILLGRQINSRMGWSPRPRPRSKGAIRATLTYTPSASSLLRARRDVVLCKITSLGASVAERLDCSPPITANRVQSPAGSLLDFDMWETCRTIPLFGGITRDPLPPPPPACALWRSSILTSFQPNLALKASLLRAARISLNSLNYNALTDMLPLKLASLPHPAPTDCAAGGRPHQYRMFLHIWDTHTQWTGDTKWGEQICCLFDIASKL
ncbi:hypothetical protein PR048_023241 [Dryococelus australis]|uniref:Uncharacterized protein n=1 Tax=Dryococelus australis TaxID=614101 RepID=A0ABQ9GTK9_9NEOP|nr:hypothetical protein PR048_023241 [Dryococelus australis]